MPSGGGLDGRSDRRSLEPARAAPGSPRAARAAPEANDSGVRVVSYDDGGEERVLGELVAGPIERDGRAATRVLDPRTDAFRALVDRRLDAAYSLAAVILGDRVEAEDAVHDAALAAWRRWDDLRDHERFEPWFRRILVNGCRDRLRARARRRVVDVGRELTEAEHPHAADPSEATADRDVIEHAFEGLGPEERVVVVLRFHLDLTVPAMAATLGIPEGTVKSRLHAALARLRRALEENAA